MAKLQPMRYKNYVWPHNPRSYSITYHRRLTARGGALRLLCTAESRTGNACDERQRRICGGRRL